MTDLVAPQLDPWQLGMTPPASVMFETPETGVAAAAAPTSPSEAAAAADPLAAGEAAGAAVAAETAETTPAPAEPQVDVRELQAELEYLREQNSAIVQWAQQQGASPAQAQQYANEQTGFDPSSLVDEFGNLNPQGLVDLFGQFGQGILGRVEQQIAQIAQPLQAQQEAQTVAEGEQRLQDILADDVSRNGEFSTDPEADRQARQLVRTLADQQFPAIAERYGVTPRAAEIAMSRAADQVRGLLKAAGATAVAQHVNHTATLAGARSEPGTGSGSGLVTIDAEVTNPDQIGTSVAQKYASRMRANGAIY